LLIVTTGGIQKEFGFWPIFCPPAENITKPWARVDQGFFCLPVQIAVTLIFLMGRTYAVHHRMSSFGFAQDKLRTAPLWGR
jgi:hypothetical protein